MWCSLTVLGPPAPPVGPCTHVDTHAQNTRVQELTGTYTPIPARGLLLGVCGGAPHLCDHNQGVTVLAGPSTVWEGSEVVAG